MLKRGRPYRPLVWHIVQLVRVVLVAGVTISTFVYFQHVSKDASEPFAEGKLLLQTIHSPLPALPTSLYQSSNDVCDPDPSMLDPIILELALWLDEKIGLCAGSLNPFQIRREVIRALIFRGSSGWSWSKIRALGARELLAVAFRESVDFATIPRRIEEEIVHTQVAQTSNLDTTPQAPYDPTAAALSVLRRKIVSLFENKMPRHVLHMLTVPELTELLGWHV